METLSWFDDLLYDVPMVTLPSVRTVAGMVTVPWYIPTVDDSDNYTGPTYMETED